MHRLHRGDILSNLGQASATLIAKYTEYLVKKIPTSRAPGWLCR